MKLLFLALPGVVTLALAAVPLLFGPALSDPGWSVSERVRAQQHALAHASRPRAAHAGHAASEPSTPPADKAR